MTWLRWNLGAASATSVTTWNYDAVLTSTSDEQPGREGAEAAKQRKTVKPVASLPAINYLTWARLTLDSFQCPFGLSPVDRQGSWDRAFPTPRHRTCGISRGIFSLEVGCPAVLKVTAKLCLPRLLRWNNQQHTFHESSPPLAKSCGAFVGDLWSLYWAFLENPYVLFPCWQVKCRIPGSDTAISVYEMHVVLKSSVSSVIGLSLILK